jgi:hypothetical protein
MGSVWDVPSPVLFNAWKHHAGVLRLRIREAAADGACLRELAARMVVIGTELMDLYVGRLTPPDISARVLADLKAEGRLALGAYRSWVEGQGGYAVLTFPEDESRWVLRLGDEGDRYVHVHPGRWSPATLRVRANVLKTAVMVLAYVRAHGGDPLDRALVNQVRANYLGLAPVGKDLAGEQGIGRIIDVLRS